MTREQLTLELEALMNNSGLTPQELVLVISHVLIDMGSSLEGISAYNTDTLETIQKQYYEEPTVGKALILQGALMTSWNK